LPPFPVGLISRYEDTPEVFVLFALTMVAISGLEGVLFRMAVRSGHMRLALSLERFGYLAAGTPVAMMALCIPLSYLSPTLALSPGS
jgi:hypothetical protein